MLEETFGHFFKVIQDQTTDNNNGSLESGKVKLTNVNILFTLLPDAQSAAMNRSITFHENMTFCHEDI